MLARDERPQLVPAALGQTGIPARPDLAAPRFGGLEVALPAFGVAEFGEHLFRRLPGVRSEGELRGFGRDDDARPVTPHFATRLVRAHRHIDHRPVGAVDQAQPPPAHPPGPVRFNRPLAGALHVGNLGVSLQDRVKRPAVVAPGGKRLVDHLIHRALERGPVGHQVHAVHKGEPLIREDAVEVLRAGIDRHADVKVCRQRLADAGHEWPDERAPALPVPGVRLDIEDHRAHARLATGLNDQVGFRVDVAALGHAPRMELQAVSFQSLRPPLNAGRAIDRQRTIGVVDALPLGAIAGLDPDLGHVRPIGLEGVGDLLDRRFGDRIAFPVPDADFPIVRRCHRTLLHPQ